LPKKLINLSIDEVSGVDKAANKRRFLIVKRAEDNTDPLTDPDKLGPLQKVKKAIEDILKGAFGSGEAKDLNTVLTERAIDEGMWQLTSSLRDSIDSILRDDTVTDKKTAVATVLQQFFVALAGSGILKGEDLAKAGRKISASRMEMLKQMLEQLQKLISEAEVVPDDTGVNKNQGGNEPVEKVTMDMLPEDVRKAIEAVPQLSQALEVQKQENTDLKKRLDDQKAENEDLKKRLEASEDAKATQVYIAKAAGYKNLPTTPQEFGEILKAVAENKATPEQVAKLEGIMKGADEAIEKGNLYGEFGRSGDGPTPGSAWEEVEKKVDELVQKGNLTKADAYTRVANENPELYQRYVRETEVRVR